MEIEAQNRTVFGKALTNIRETGLIPAELYGRGLSNLHLSLSAKVFSKVFKEAGSSTVLNLVVDGKKHPVLVHDVEYDRLSGEISHVDFYQVELGKKIRVKVPLVFSGESPAVKNLSGVLNTVMNEIEVEATPDHLPHEISVSLESLAEIGQTIRVSDLKLPKDVTVHIDPETAIASVSEQRAEEVSAPTEAPDVSSVKVESEEKKAERAEKKESESGK